jgi:Holliday junction resolvase RusA-like endonuclease
LEGPVSLKLIVKGEGRGDTDNIAGAFMDAAQGILWIDDRVSVIPKLSIEWQRAAKVDSEWIAIIHHTSV